MRRTILALLLVMVAAQAHAQGGPGVHVSPDCSTIAAPVAATICYDTTLSAWRRWNGSAWVSVGGASSGSSGALQYGDGSGGFADDAALTWDPTNDVLTTSGVALNLVTKTSAYTATRADHVILVDATSGGVTITLPTAATKKGLVLVVKKIDSSANAVTVARASSDTIDGDTTATINNQYTAVSLVSDGVSAWAIY